MPRELVYFVATTLDGFIAGPDRGDPSGSSGLPDAYPHLRHLVFSTSMRTSPAPAVELVARDPVATVRELKAEDGQDIWLVGGAGLAHTLLPEIDRQHPTVISSGVHLFDGPFATGRFRLRSERALASGIRILDLDRVRP